jgi:scyllo-inositol 2-dehydrogenase (NADP+)
MRAIVVGLGVQGNKRRKFAGAEFVTAVDPVNAEAQHRKVEDVPLASYDAALVCIPDEPKIEVLTYLLGNGKHVLVEKPLWAGDDGQILELEQLARTKNVFCYTAYNHRFEPHYVRMRELVRSGALGKIYRCRMFYGNGTARLVRNSEWRDQGAGVLPDLGSHLLDTVKFWFGDCGEGFEVVSANCFENRAPDHVVIASRTAPAQARTRNDTALMAQSFHLRRVRRKRDRAYPFAVQVGTDDVHASHPRVAERPPPGGTGYVCTG